MDRQKKKKYYVHYGKFNNWEEAKTKLDMLNANYRTANRISANDNTGIFGYKKVTERDGTINFMLVRNHTKYTNDEKHEIRKLENDSSIDLRYSGTYMDDYLKYELYNKDFKDYADDLDKPIIAKTKTNIAAQIIRDNKLKRTDALIDNLTSSDKNILDVVKLMKAMKPKPKLNGQPIVRNWGCVLDRGVMMTGDKKFDERLLTYLTDKQSKSTEACSYRKKLFVVRHKTTSKDDHYFYCDMNGNKGILPSVVENNEFSAGVYSMTESSGMEKGKYKFHELPKQGEFRIIEDVGVLLFNNAVDMDVFLKRFIINNRSTVNTKAVAKFAVVSTINGYTPFASGLLSSLQLITSSEDPDYCITDGNTIQKIPIIPDNQVDDILDGLGINRDKLISHDIVISQTIVMKGAPELNDPSQYDIRYIPKTFKNKIGNIGMGGLECFMNSGIAIFSTYADAQKCVDHCDGNIGKYIYYISDKLNMNGNRKDFWDYAKKVVGNVLGPATITLLLKFVYDKFIAKKIASKFILDAAAGVIGAGVTGGPVGLIGGFLLTILKVIGRMAAIYFGIAIVGAIMSSIPQVRNVIVKIVVTGIRVINKIVNKLTGWIRNLFGVDDDMEDDVIVDYDVSVP